MQAAHSVAKGVFATHSLSLDELFRVGRRNRVTRDNGILAGSHGHVVGDVDFEASRTTDMTVLKDFGVEVIAVSNEARVLKQKAMIIRGHNDPTALRRNISLIQSDLQSDELRIGIGSRDCDCGGADGGSACGKQRGNELVGNVAQTISGTLGGRLKQTGHGLYLIDVIEHEVEILLLVDVKLLVSGRQGLRAGKRASVGADSHIGEGVDVDGVAIILNLTLIVAVEQRHIDVLFAKVLKDASRPYFGNKGSNSHFVLILSLFWQIT